MWHEKVNDSQHKFIITQLYVSHMEESYQTCTQLFFDQPKKEIIYLFVCIENWENWRWMERRRTKKKWEDQLCIGRGNEITKKRVLRISPQLKEVHVFISLGSSLDVLCKGTLLFSHPLIAQKSRKLKNIRDRRLSIFFHMTSLFYWTRGVCDEKTHTLKLILLTLFCNFIHFVVLVSIFYCITTAKKKKIFLSSHFHSFFFRLFLSFSFRFKFVGIGLSSVSLLWYLKF
jgi:hypothetical protein